MKKLKKFLAFSLAALMLFTMHLPVANAFYAATGNMEFIDEFYIEGVAPDASVYDVIESVEYKTISVTNPLVRTVHDVTISVGRGNNPILGPFV